VTGCYSNDKLLIYVGSNYNISKDHVDVLNVLNINNNYIFFKVSKNRPKWLRCRFVRKCSAACLGKNPDNTHPIYRCTQFSSLFLDPFISWHLIESF
jgi:hypothetical protein